MISIYLILIVLFCLLDCFRGYYFHLFPKKYIGSFHSQTKTIQRIKTLQLQSNPSDDNFDLFDDYSSSSSSSLPIIPSSNNSHSFSVSSKKPSQSFFTTKSLTINNHTIELPIDLWTHQNISTLFTTHFQSLIPLFTKLLVINTQKTKDILYLLAQQSHPQEILSYILQYKQQFFPRQGNNHTLLMQHHQLSSSSQEIINQIQQLLSQSSITSLEETTNTMFSWLPTLFTKLKHKILSETPSSMTINTLEHWLKNSTENLSVKHVNNSNINVGLTNDTELTLIISTNEQHNMTLLQQENELPDEIILEVEESYHEPLISLPQQTIEISDSMNSTHNSSSSVTSSTSSTSISSSFDWNNLLFSLPIFRKQSIHTNESQSHLNTTILLPPITHTNNNNLTSISSLSPETNDTDIIPYEINKTKFLIPHIADMFTHENQSTYFNQQTNMSHGLLISKEFLLALASTTWNALKATPLTHLNTTMSSHSMSLTQQNLTINSDLQQIIQQLQQNYPQYILIQTTNANTNAEGNNKQMVAGNNHSMVPNHSSLNENNVTLSSITSSSSEIPSSSSSSSSFSQYLPSFLPFDISSMTSSTSQSTSSPPKQTYSYEYLQQIMQAIKHLHHERDIKYFIQTIGILPMLDIVLYPSYVSSDEMNKQIVRNIQTNQTILDRVEAIKGIGKLLIVEKQLADQLGCHQEFLDILCDMMNLPYQNQQLIQIFGNKRSYRMKAKEIALRYQHEALVLIHRMIRNSEIATQFMKQHTRLRELLQIIMNDSPSSTSTTSTSSSQSSTNTPESQEISSKSTPSTSQSILKPSQTLNGTTTLIESIPFSFENTKLSKSFIIQKRNSTTIIEYINLKPNQMARVASWGLGGVPWKPKSPGQKGLRILSLDGGGTKGVLTISYLKEIFAHLPPGKQPYDVFDMICGTSTGGIIAMLLGCHGRTIQETENLYDEFIHKIFAQKSNLKLVTEQAAYDAIELERILYKMCGDQLLLDSNHDDCPRVFCISTKINNYPPIPQIWRNYEYPNGQKSRYPGSYRVNTMTAVRATTAAPTFFTPVLWKNELFCDGALVANNPAAIAIQEAKAIYPGVPIELVVSIGTGYHATQKQNLQSIGWDLLVNQLIASTTDTEDVHGLLHDFLSTEQYYRFNPILQENIAIDEKKKEILDLLKQIAKEHFQDLLVHTSTNQYQLLLDKLSGKKPKSRGFLWSSSD